MINSFVYLYYQLHFFCLLLSLLLLKAILLTFTCDVSCPLLKSLLRFKYYFEFSLKSFVIFSYSISIFFFIFYFKSTCFQIIFMVFKFTFSFYLTFICLFVPLQLFSSLSLLFCMNKFLILNLWFYYFNNQLILNHTNDVNLFLFLVKVFRLDGLMCQTLLQSLAISSLKVFFMNYKPVCINTARLFYLHIFLLFNLIRTNTFIFY